MSAYMNRKAAMHWGLNWPPDIACMEPSRMGGNRYVTWTEVHDRQRKRQAERLADIRRIPVPQIQPCYVWTFYNDTWLYGGWYCYVVTRHQHNAVNFQGLDKKLAISLMTEIAVGVLPDAANFTSWMEAMTRRYPRRQSKDPRLAGSVIGWLRDKRIFTRQRPTASCQ